MMYVGVHVTAHVWKPKDNFHFSVGPGDCTEVTRGHQVYMVSELTTVHSWERLVLLLPTVIGFM